MLRLRKQHSGGKILLCGAESRGFIVRWGALNFYVWPIPAWTIKCEKILSGDKILSGVLEVWGRMLISVCGQKCTKFKNQQRPAVTLVNCLVEKHLKESWRAYFGWSWPLSVTLSRLLKYSDLSSHHWEKMRGGTIAIIERTVYSRESGKYPRAWAVEDLDLGWSHRSLQSRSKSSDIIEASAETKQGQNIPDEFTAVRFGGAGPKRRTQERRLI